jgi:hypothetical protein
LFDGSNSAVSKSVVEELAAFGGRPRVERLTDQIPSHPILAVFLTFRKTSAAERTQVVYWEWGYTWEFPHDRIRENVGYIHDCGTGKPFPEKDS